MLRRTNHRISSSETLPQTSHRISEARHGRRLPSAVDHSPRLVATAARTNLTLGALLRESSAADVARKTISPRFVEPAGKHFPQRPRGRRNRYIKSRRMSSWLHRLMKICTLCAQAARTWWTSNCPVNVLGDQRYNRSRSIRGLPAIRFSYPRSSLYLGLYYGLAWLLCVPMTTRHYNRLGRYHSGLDEVTTKFSWSSKCWTIPPRGYLQHS